MKQVIVNVDPAKYKFFIELMESLDFVTVQKKGATKKQALQHVAEGMQAAMNASKNKVKSRPAKDFLKEL